MPIIRPPNETGLPDEEFYALVREENLVNSFRQRSGEGRPPVAMLTRTQQPEVEELPETAGPPIRMPPRSRTNLAGGPPAAGGSFVYRPPHTLTPYARQTGARISSKPAFAGDRRSRAALATSEVYVLPGPPSRWGASSFEAPSLVNTDEVMPEVQPRDEEHVVHSDEEEEEEEEAENGFAFRGTPDGLAAALYMAARIVNDEQTHHFHHHEVDHHFHHHRHVVGHDDDYHGDDRPREHYEGHRHYLDVSGEQLRTAIRLSMAQSQAVSKFPKGSDHPETATEHVHKSTNTEEKTGCSICQEDMPDVRVQLVCGHQFHSECICQWLNNHPTCPNCKRNVLPCDFCMCFDEADCSKDKGIKQLWDTCGHRICYTCRTTGSWSECEICAIKPTAEEAD